MGFYTIDSLLSRDWQTFVSSVSLLLPAVTTLGFVLIATIAKMARTAMLQVLGSDYIRTAKALGLSTRSIVLYHALPNALVPVLTSLGIVFGYLIGGNVIVENTFAWPGLGRYAWNAIMSNDIYALQGFVLCVAIGYVLINLVIDILYSVVDPRIRLAS